MGSKLHITLLLSALSATGVWIGMLLPHWWPLAILGFALYCYNILFQTSSHLHSFLQGAVIGLAAGGAGVWWMWDMFPLTDPVGMSAASQLVIISMVWGITALIAGVSAGVAGLAIHHIRSSRAIALLIPIIWVIQEEARMWLYALYSYSSESLLGPHFSQTALGYVAANSDYLLQLAYPLGLPFLTFAVTALAAALAYSARILVIRTGSRSGFIALTLAALILVLPLIRQPSHAATNTLPTVVFSTTDSLTSKDLQQLFEASVRDYPDAKLFVFPEGVSPEFVQNTDYLKQLFGERNVLIMSSIHGASATSTTATIVYDTPDGRLAIYQKLFLMPQGEYLPAIAHLLFPLSGDRNALMYAAETGKRLERGSELIAPAYENYRIGGLLCSDILSPHLYRSLVNEERASVLVNLSNPSWFHNSKNYHDTVTEIAKVHAVQNNRSFIVASHNAPSFIMSVDGSISAQTVWGEASALYQKIPVSN